MHSRSLVLIVLSIFVLAGCAVQPLADTAASAQDLAAARSGPTLADASIAESAGVDAWLAEPLTVSRAVRIALLHNPALRGEYARLGIARAALLDAVRLPNPVFGYSDLAPSSGPSQITKSLWLSFADVLLLPSRRSIAQGEYDAARLGMAAHIFDVALDTEAAWFEYAGAEQVARMRDGIAQVAASNARIAERFVAAGNMPDEQLQAALAAESEARMAAREARQAAVGARGELNVLMGLDAAAGARWCAETLLATPVAEEDSAEQVQAIAASGRLDVLALRERVTARESAARAAQGFRWLGVFDIGVERERETDGETIRGGGVAVEIPLFNQGQGRVAAADAEVIAAQAELTAREIEADHARIVAQQAVASARATVADYHDALIPQRERLLAREQERFNFMLIGFPVLLAALAEKYAAYEGYIDALREYWLARVRLQRAIGGALPSGARIGAPVELPQGGTP
jgi:outer membrane protein TolC